jgi:hypothetical protein
MLQIESGCRNTKGNPQTEAMHGGQSKMGFKMVDVMVAEPSMALFMFAGVDTKLFRP